ncbi:MgtC/SapB family protein [Salegentibacter chungangensis]|uniref:MgtC/SapB family protein n=1 Tax=Salegentibacter chungangensis TaxID=1335724 RepID=A0ABW3NPR9_9FLAO
MELADFSMRIGTALIAGLIIGAERELRGKHAGLKTNALVAVGSCVFILLSLEFRGEEYVDITRVLGQVVTGIGFIGAGAILQHGKSVTGLTTAATTWCSAGAGCLAAVDMYKELAVLSAIVLVTNMGFSYVEHRLRKKGKKKGEEQKSEPDQG